MGDDVTAVSHRGSPAQVRTGFAVSVGGSRCGVVGRPVAPAGRAVAVNDGHVVGRVALTDAGKELLFLESR